jgi:hypothetical protein
MRRGPCVDGSELVDQVKKKKRKMQMRGPMNNAMNQRVWLGREDISSIVTIYDSFSPSADDAVPLRSRETFLSLGLPRVTGPASKTGFPSSFLPRERLAVSTSRKYFSNTFEEGGEYLEVCSPLAYRIRFSSRR